MFHTPLPDTLLPFGRKLSATSPSSNVKVLTLKSEKAVSDWKEGREKEHIQAHHPRNVGATLHPATDAATDGEDAGTRWEVPGLQPPLPNLVYSE